MERPEDRSRLNEWFVPRFGSPRFRAAVGLLFLPYTGMVLAFTLFGAMLAEIVHWDRVAAILAIYFLALGIGAHALDALGSRETKPWGDMFSKRQLRLLAFVSVASAYAIGIPYMLGPAPLLWWIAIAGGLFSAGLQPRVVPRALPHRWLVRPVLGRAAGACRSCPADQ